MPVPTRERVAKHRQKRREREQRIDSLLSQLTDKERQAILIWPVFVGGDSTDMETWLAEVYNGQPLQSDRLKFAMRQFNAWYAEEKPGEYHDPIPPWDMFSGLVARPE